jgi:O-antigen/teichoic acid export membrane protein
MSTIRRQSIISSGIVYIGFAMGAATNLIFAKVLTLEQNGLVMGLFVSIGNIMSFLSGAGMPSFINKFYPYYKENLKDKDNDMMGLALLSTLTAFLLVLAAGLVFRPLVIRKFGNNSELLIHYYYWIFPFGLGLCLYTVLESYAWMVGKSILTSYLREFQLRLFNLLLILLLLLGVINGYDVFVKLYSLTYLSIAAILVVYLIRNGQLHFSFSVSRVTKRFLPKIKALVLLTWTGNVLFNISFFFPAIVIAAVVPHGAAAVAVFTWGQFIASLIMAPQRGVAAAAIAHLSKAWRDKDYGRINRIYSRSVINQLIFAVGMFILIALNFRDAILTLKLNRAYLGSEIIFIIVGFNRIIDMGTGLNTQILGTSTFWRFDFYTGMILVSLTIPLNYLLAREIGISGPAIADIITFGLYNTIRCIFLYRKFGMQPFTRHSLYTLLLGAAVYFICRMIFNDHQGFLWLVLRSLAIIALYGCGVLVLRLSDDIAPVWETVKKRLGMGSGL